MEQQQQQQEQTTNQKHIEVLTRTLEQLEAFSFKNEESKANLRAALEAAVSALEKDQPDDSEQQRGGSGGGLDLSESAMEHLTRLVSGEDDRATAKAKRNRDAVMTLAALVDQVPADHEAETSPAVSTLARLVRNEG